ncbi:MAG: AbrB/MazE/SpoVT family DNA-binding domain-containing protein [archaeon]
MNRRRIQLIAGTTYTLSLPKEWVRRNKLKEQDEILIDERGDGTLVLLPHSKEKRTGTDITFQIDDFLDSIEQVLFSFYHLGFETITLWSKKEMPKATRALIRKSITYMSGTEIVHEDEKKIIIKILLDKNRIDLTQVLYRMGLILQNSAAQLIGEIAIADIRIGEQEIDRLYHLNAKVLSLALQDNTLLSTARIQHLGLILLYSLINKKLENIGDVISRLAEYLHDHKLHLEQKKDVQFIMAELDRSLKHVHSPFLMMSKDVILGLKEKLPECKDTTIRYHLSTLLRYVIDVQEEMVSVSFHQKLIHEKII